MKGVIDIEFNYKSVERALNDLLKRAEDPSEAMKDVAGILKQATNNAFENEADPATGVAWDPLSATTLATRPNREGGEILQDRRRLRRSMVTDYGKVFAEIGTNVIYAATHQFGAQQGQYGKSSRGGPIPWGDIPARPFFGVSPEDEEDILDIATRYMADAWKD